MGYLTWESIGRHLWVIVLFLAIFAIAILIITGGIRPIMDSLLEAIGENPISFE